MPVADTSQTAHELQVQLYREAGPERRAAIVAELSEAMRELCREGTRIRHPSYSDAQIREEVLRIFYGRQRERP